MQPLSYNPDEPQYPQALDWSCSACSLAWMNRALGIQLATDEHSAIEYIGSPENINSNYGLMDASGSVLAARLREQGAPAFYAWLQWPLAFQLAHSMPLLIGGVGWNHWSAVQGVGDEVLWLANSAEGWMNVYDSMDEIQYYNLGPFAVVAVPLLHNFPSPPPA